MELEASLCHEKGQSWKVWMEGLQGCGGAGWFPLAEVGGPPWKQSLVGQHTCLSEGRLGAAPHQTHGRVQRLAGACAGGWAVAAPTVVWPWLFAARESPAGTPALRAARRWGSAASAHPRRPWLSRDLPAHSLGGGGRRSRARSVGCEGCLFSWGETKAETLGSGSLSPGAPKGLLVLVGGSPLLSGASKVGTCYCVDDLGLTVGWCFVLLWE